MNNVVLIGRATKDLELKYLQTGTAVSTFTIAVDKGLSKEKQEETKSKGQPTADFINIVAWGKQAEFIAEHLKKGKLVGVQGRIQTRTYDANDGSKRYITEIVAQQLEVLEWEKSDSTDDYMQGFKEVESDNIPF